MPHPSLARVLQFLWPLLRTPAGAARTDRELVEVFIAERNEDAFATLVCRHGPMVLGLCRRLLGDSADAEDAFQATFLVLAQRVAAIPWRENIGSWLYEVAYRTARKARCAAIHRRFCEKEAGQMRLATSKPALENEERQTLLDDEVRRLPAKYRQPVMLCYLQGLSRADAARQLGWKEGTVASRLARARDLLRDRLVRRGLATSAAGLSLELTAEKLTAAVSSEMARGTVQAALVTGNVSASGVVSASVCALAKGVLRDMAWAKTKSLLAVLLILSLLGSGAGLLAYNSLAAQPSGSQAIDGGQRAARAADERLQAETKQGVLLDRSGDALPAGARARLGTARLRHFQHFMPTAGRVIFSGNGKLLASQGQGAVHLWDSDTGQELHCLGGKVGDHFFSCGFSADVKTLITAGTLDGGTPSVHVWDMASGKLMRQFPLQQAEEDTTNDGWVSPTGKTVVARKGEKILEIWDVATSRKLRQHTASAVRSITFSYDGTVLAWQDQDEKEVHFLGPRSGEELGKVRLDSQWSCALSADGKVLAAIIDDGIVLFEVPGGKELRRFPTKLRTNVGASIAFSADGKWLASASIEPMVRLWETATGKEVRQFHHRPPCQEDNADGTTLWYLCCVVSSVALSPDGKKMAALDGHNTIHLWETATGNRLPGELEGHRGPVKVVRISADGQTIATAGCDHTVRLWEGATGKERFRLHHELPLAMDLSPDGKLLASGSAHGSLRLWDAITGKQCHQWQASAEFLAFSPDGKALASLAGGTLRLYDVASREKVNEWQGKAEAFVWAAFSPDGRTIASCSRQGDMGLWDLTTGKNLRQWQGKSGQLSLIAFSPDGRTLVSRVRDGDSREAQEAGHKIYLWETATGEERARIACPVTDRSPVTFSADSRVLVSAGPNGTIHLWDLANGKQLAPFAGQRGQLTCLTTSANGKIVVSSSEDTTVLAWDLASRLPRSESPGVKLSSHELEDLWKELAGSDAAKAYRTIWALTAAPQQGVPLLGERLKSVPRLPPQQLPRLIAGLDAETFEAREQAMAELEKLGELAHPALLKALAAKPALELRKRLEQLLAKLDNQPLSADTLRLVRAVEVLERCGSTEARLVLEKLAQGAEGARLTREAQGAMERLAHLSSDAP